MNPCSLCTRKTLNKGKRSGKKSVSKIITTEHKKKVENYDFMNNTAQAQAGIDFGSIESRNIDFAKNKLQRILSENVGRALENMARNMSFMEYRKQTLCRIRC